MYLFISQDNPSERIPGQLTKQQEAEKTADQVPAEKKFMNISYFDIKMIVIASAAMVFSIICGKPTYLEEIDWKWFYFCCKKQAKSCNRKI